MFHSSSSNAGAEWGCKTNLDASMNILGQDVAPVGMGCWPIGGRFFLGDEPLGFPDVDDGTAIQIVHAALDAGIRVFDTAGVYGAGRSELLLGRALKRCGDAVVISKLGMLFDEQSRQVLANECGVADVENAIEASLQRLQRDRVDIMLLHLNALSVTQAQPIFEAMETARVAGKIRAYGWSTDFPASATAMTDMPGFIAVEHAMNVLADAPSMQATVAQHGLVALIRSPLAMGVLTGKYDETLVVTKDDVRFVNSEKRDYFRDGKAAPHHLSTLRAVRDLLRTGGRSLAQGALGWLLAKSHRNLPLPGARSVAQMTENAGALVHGPLPDDVMHDIEAIILRAPEGEPRAR